MCGSGVDCSKGESLRHDVYGNGVEPLRYIGFYQRFGATFFDDWKVVCLKGDALKALAKEARLEGGNHF